MLDARWQPRHLLRGTRRLSTPGHMPQRLAAPYHGHAPVLSSPPQGHDYKAEEERLHELEEYQVGAVMCSCAVSQQLQARVHHCGCPA